MILSRRNLLLSAAAFAVTKFDYPWKLGVITDEAAFNLDKVLKQFVPEYGLHWVEIREVELDGKRKYVAQDATPEDLRQIRKQLDDAGVKLSVLDTGIYKIALPGTTPVGSNSADLNQVEGAYQKQLENLKRAADAAHALGTDKLRIFTFKRVADPNAIFSRIVDELNKALDVARAQGVTLLVENEFDCNVATGTETAKLFKAIPNKRLEHNWDPGNCMMAGENPFPDAWDQLDKSRIGHMHLKDSDGKKWLPVGSGKIDFVGQFRALKKMHFAQTMSLETHYRNPQNDRWTSSEESMNGLMKVLSQV